MDSRKLAQVDLNIIHAIFKIHDVLRKIVTPDCDFEMKNLERIMAKLENKLNKEFPDY